MTSTTFVEHETVIEADWLNDVNDIVYAIRSIGHVYLLEYIPESLWPGLAAGTDTTDMGVYINTALAALAATGGELILPPWTLCHSTTITWSSKSIVLNGTAPKEGITASSARGCCLKWTGSSAVGTTQVKLTQGAHKCAVKNIMFDANDKAEICLWFATEGVATPQPLHMPTADNLHFIGYRGQACVFGNADTSVLDTGQFQQAAIRNCSWWGGGATATASNVYALTLNAQNCEILHMENCFFDPYPVTQCNHNNHILVKTGGLHILSSTFTRANSYDINVIGECGLVVDHARTEDPLFLLMAAGFASNPVQIKNVIGRDGTATGAETFISIGGGGGQAILLENILSTGHIRVFGANDNNITTKNIVFETPGTSSLAISGGTPYVGTYDLESAGGVRVLNASAPSEEWKSLTNSRFYKNNAGKLRITSLQSTGAAAESNNLCGTATISAGNTSATVTFATAEPDASYRVMIFAFAASGGTAAAGSYTIKPAITRTTTDFTFTVDAAPGGAVVVTYVWLLLRS